MVQMKPVVKATETIEDEVIAEVFSSMDPPVWLTCLMREVMAQAITDETAGACLAHALEMVRTTILEGREGVRVRPEQP